MLAVRAKLAVIFKVFGVCLAAALAACGENEPNVAGLSYPVSASPIPAASTGTFRAFVSSSNGAGAITVGGQTYNVATANITESGQLSGVAAIRPGSLVTLTLSSGAVTAVDISPVFSGPVALVDVSGATFTGLGQTIGVDAHTTFTGTSLATLAQGNVVTVRGYVQRPGRLVATHVELVSTTLVPGGRVYVAGIAQMVNPTVRSFNLGTVAQGGTLSVNYAAAINLGSTLVAENTPVIASSRSAPALGSTDFTAQEVMLFDGSAATPSTTVPGSGNVGGVPSATQVRGVVMSNAGSGSITVGGQTYSIGSATVSEGGRAATASAIRTGSLVTLNMPSGTVSSIEIHTLFTGPLESVNALASTLAGFGQTMRVDANTAYSGRTLATLTSGTVVTVSGYLQGGVIYATRVDYVSDALTTGTRVSVAGTAQFVNSSFRSFNLGMLSVNYTAATTVTSLVDNTPVIVYSTVAPIGNQFNAQDVAVFAGSQPTTPANPNVPGGTNTVSATGHVDAVVAASNVFSVLGIPFTVSPSTVYVNSAQPGSAFSLTNLPPRAKVQVTATPGSLGTYLAQQVTLISPTDDGDTDPVTLSAPLTAVANPNLGVGTLQITTTLSTQFAISSSSSDAATFFSRAIVGSNVTVTGTYSLGVLTATRITM